MIHAIPYLIHRYMEREECRVGALNSYMKKRGRGMGRDAYPKGAFHLFVGNSSDLGPLGWSGISRQTREEAP